MSYHFTRWPIAVAAAVSLSGCGLDALEGNPSDFQIEQERRAAFALPVETVEVAALAEPTPEPYVAPCVMTFRVNRCNGNEVTPW